MDAIQMFLRQHAQVHAAEPGQAEGSLADEYIRRRPREGLNSLAWIFWHMARAEDAGMNVVLAGEPQVLDQDDWLERLHVARRDIGTSMTSDEVAALSMAIDVKALRDYRTAVGRKTREVARRLPREGLEDLIDAPALSRVAAAGVLGERAGWVLPLWARRPKVWFLTWVATGHNFAHLGEAICVRSQAGLGVGYWNTGEFS
jgi:hypothetical protein